MKKRKVKGATKAGAISPRTRKATKRANSPNTIARQTRKTKGGARRSRSRPTPLGRWNKP